MNNKAENSRLLYDKNKADLGSLDLFDKVINVKLTDADGNEYLIRSDYEMYYPNLTASIITPDTSGVSISQKNSKFYIRKCAYKPSLKVNYKRVSLSTPVSVDLYLSNFFMLDRSGKLLKTFNSITNRLVRVDIALGYFGQFKSLMQKGKAQDIQVEDLFNFDKDMLTSHGITVITMNNVVYVQTDKLPPDMTVHIHGYVGTYYSAKGIQDLAGGLPSNYEDILRENIIIQSDYTVSRGNTLFEEACFEMITKNWVSGAVDLSKPELKEFAKNVDKNNMIKVGSMTDAQAMVYGLQVHFSAGVHKLSAAYDEANGEAKIEKVKTANTAIEKLNNILAKVNFSKTVCHTLIPEDGSLFLYLEEEASTGDKLLTPKLLAQYDKTSATVYWDNKLPAVYNITTDSLCTVSCPFFFLLNPFQKFYFKSAYALSGMVTYYANFTAEENEFYALWQTISFATVEDINECNIVCTGKKKGGV